MCTCKMWDKAVGKLFLHTAKDGVVSVCVHIQKSYLWKDFLRGREEISVDNKLRGNFAVLLLQRQMGLSAFTR